MSCVWRHCKACTRCVYLTERAPARLLHTTQANTMSTPRGHESWKFNQVWAKRRATVEERYKELCAAERAEAEACLPWERRDAGGRCLQIGNSSKVAYLEIMTHRHTGAAVVEFGSSGWHNIKQFVIAQKHRAAFDIGYVPSAVYCTSAFGQVEGTPSCKTVYKIWRTMGFSQRVQKDDSLLFEYRQETLDTMMKQCDTANQKRKSAARESAIVKELDEITATAELRAAAAERREVAARLRLESLEQRANSLTRHDMSLGRLLN